MKNRKITKKVTKEKLVRIIKRRDTQSLLAIQEDQFDWEVLNQPLHLEYITMTLLEWIIRMGYVFKNEENLKKVVNDQGQTVAHMMAWRGYKFDPDKDVDIICLADKYGWTVAHMMASRRYRFDPDRHREILSLANSKGITVAHVMAKKGYKFDPDKHVDLLRLADKYGWTVAHEMARGGYRFDPDRHKEILLLANSKGTTVAHVMAGAGYLFDPDRHGEICKLKDEEGYSVLEHFIIKNHRKIMFGSMDQDLMRLSLEGVRKYVQAAKRLKNISCYLYEGDFFEGMYVHEYLKKIFTKKELEKELDSLGLKL